MQIKQNPGPKGADVLLGETIDHILHSKLVPAEFMNSQRNQITVGLPHRIWDLNLESLAQEGSLSNAKQNGFCYLVRNDKTLIAIAELSINLRGEAESLHTIGIGESIKHYMGAIARIQVPSGNDAELSLLRCSPLCFMAFLLDDGKSLQIFPIRPLPSWLEDKVYDEANLLPILKTEAQNMLKSLQQYAAENTNPFA